MIYVKLFCLWQFARSVCFALSFLPSCLHAIRQRAQAHALSLSVSFFFTAWYSIQIKDKTSNQLFLLYSLLSYIFMKIDFHSYSWDIVEHLKFIGFKIHVKCIKWKFQSYLEWPFTWRNLYFEFFFSSENSLNSTGDPSCMFPYNQLVI